MTPKANPLQASPIARTRIEEIRERLDRLLHHPSAQAETAFYAHADRDVTYLLSLVASQGRRISALEQALIEAERWFDGWCPTATCCAESGREVHEQIAAVLPLPRGPQG